MVSDKNHSKWHFHQHFFEKRRGANHYDEGGKRKIKVQKPRIVKKAESPVFHPPTPLAGILFTSSTYI